MQSRALKCHPGLVPGSISSGALDVNGLQNLSGKQQRRQLEAIKSACKAYIQGPLLCRLNDQLTDLLMQACCPPDALPVVVDQDDVDQQTLLVRYPSAMA